jgi:hypothetical protein
MTSIRPVIDSDSWRSSAGDALPATEIWPAMAAYDQHLSRNAKADLSNFMAATIEPGKR